jgi:SOS-response transcriptional repressor LexA
MNKENIRLPLTKKQKLVLQYIIDYFGENHYPPTYNEIKKTFNYKSAGHSYAVVKALVHKGYLDVSSLGHRSIRLTGISESMQTSKQRESKKDGNPPLEKGEDRRE